MKGSPEKPISIVVHFGADSCVRQTYIIYFIKDKFKNMGAQIREILKTQSLKLTGYYKKLCLEYLSQYVPLSLHGDSGG